MSYPGHPFWTGKSCPFAIDSIFKTLLMGVCSLILIIYTQLNGLELLFLFNNHLFACRWFQVFLSNIDNLQSLISFQVINNNLKVLSLLSCILMMFHYVAANGYSGREVVGGCWSETFGIKRIRPLLPTDTNWKVGRFSLKQDSWAETCSMNDQKREIWHTTCVKNGQQRRNIIFYHANVESSGRP